MKLWPNGLQAHAHVRIHSNRRKYVQLCDFYLLIFYLECFDNSVLESDVNQTMSTVYESFMILITNLQKCVIVNSPAIACKNCLSAYTAASLVYSNIVSLTGNEHVCYDIKDAVSICRLVST